MRSFRAHKWSSRMVMEKVSVFVSTKVKVQLYSTVKVNIFIGSWVVWVSCWHLLLNKFAPSSRSHRESNCRTLLRIHKRSKCAFYWLSIWVEDLNFNYNFYRFWGLVSQNLGRMMMVYSLFLLNYDIGLVATQGHAINILLLPSSTGSC